MPRSILCLLVLDCLALVATPAAQAQLPISLMTEDTISVTVQGQATGAPDRALVTVELTIPAASLLEGFQQINDQIEEIRGALEKTEVPADAVTVKGPTFVTTPAFGPFGAGGGGGVMMFQPPPPPAPAGGPQRQAKASLTAALPVSQEDLEGALKRLDEVVQALTDAGHAPQIAFALANPAALDAALMQDGITKARTQAAALATALGGEVGGVMSAQSVDMEEMMGSYMKGIFEGMAPIMQLVGGMLGGAPANPREVTVTRLVIVNFRFVRPQ
jgi:uncharacterized protein YggE